MQYPIDMRFTRFSIGQSITARDAANNVIMYVKQKAFRLKEKVEIYPDTAKSSVIFRIEADRVIDWSANYQFTDGQGNDWGAVRRKGMKSLWAAHYEVMQEGEIDMVIREENPIKKVIEGILGEIPFLGLIAIYLLNPTYIVKRENGQELLRVRKRPAFLATRFTIEKLTEIPEDDELRSLMALIMMVLLERRR